MKKLFLAAFVALTAIAANAQSWVGGSLGIDFTTPKGGETVTTFTISPEYGYNFNDKWAIGVALEEESTFIDNSTVNVVSIEPFARFTFAKTGIVSFFVDGGVGFGCEFAEQDGETFDDYSAWGWSIGFKPGVKIAVTESLSLVAKLGFFGYKQFEAGDAYPDAVSYSSFGLTANTDALSIGMHWEF